MMFLHNTARAQTDEASSRKDYLPSLIGKKNIILNLFHQIILPHSLTSSQGQSEDHFPMKLPAPPLAPAPVGTLGSWPLPPPPGLCWYGSGFELMLVGGLKEMGKETL